MFLAVCKTGAKFCIRLFISNAKGRKFSTSSSKEVTLKGSVQGFLEESRQQSLHLHLMRLAFTDSSSPSCGERKHRRYHAIGSYFSYEPPLYYFEQTLNHDVDFRAVFRSGFTAIETYAGGKGSTLDDSTKPAISTLENFINLKGNKIQLYYSLSVVTVQRKRQLGCSN